MKILKNDTVQILSGVDQGKVGKVIVAVPQGDKVIVQGINLRYKHIRRSQDYPRGARIQRESPLPVSKVELVCPNCGKPTRVGYQFFKDRPRERKQRICRKCKQVIPKIL